MPRHIGAKVEYCFAILALLFALPASAAMLAPVANAGPDRTGSVNVAITFSGSGSSDPDGSIALYSWQFGDGGAGTATTSSIAHTYAAAGTYSLSLWVRDNAGIWSTTNDVALVTIGGGATPTTTTTTTSLHSTTTTPVANNKPPVAKAGPDQATQTLITLTFNGSGSSDPDGTIATSIWTFGDGTSASGLVVTHQYAAAGTYTATLAVADNRGAVATDTARITVANRPPTANAGPDTTGAPGAAIGLSGSASSDPDGSIVTYAWTFGDGTSGSGSNPTHAYATAGAYTASLTVTDNNGAQSTDSSVVTVASGGSSTWARSVGGSGSDGAYGVAADAAGNVFAGGTLRGSMTVGGTTLTSAGLGDWFIVKYSPTGAVLWAKRFGGTGDDALESLAADADGNVIATGRFAGTVSFGGTALVASGASDIVLAKYAGADGAHKWSKRFGGIFDDLGTGVAVDTAKNVYLTGYFRGTVDFGGGPITVPLDTDLDAFVAKFDTNGTPGWSKHFWNSGTDRGTAIAVAGGYVAVVGYFTNSINFNSPTITTSILDAGAPYADAFVTKLAASDGAHVWSKQIGTVLANDFAYGVAIDTTGSVVVTGFVTGSVNFGGGALTALGGWDGYVAKYAASNGAHQWSRRIGGSQDDQAYAVAVDASNNVYVAGGFQNVASFGGGSLTTDFSQSDGYVAKYSPTGAPAWVRRLGGTGAADLAQDITVGASGYPSVVGYFNGSGSFAGAPLTSAGQADGFVGRLAP
jgi:PKD repeat protein